MKKSMSEQIRLLLKRKNMTIKKLSTLLETSNQNMANKLRRDNFSMKELEAIADALDCEIYASFIEKNID
ncbi:Transcriptional regulator [Petrocella atlantisensis]|uniref:Transcriptional regulator n=1 Tax=Petrocella atlantisensis TaxID=2173034 RepID=A0A3P7RX73_9FIRM|nr:helix-turn-helix domain-containing protein [Petrocella atlantisensis]VDN47336.1 Transcriptional regulator [Petrocella atlantisensis]